MFIWAYGSNHYITNFNHSKHQGQTGSILYCYRKVGINWKDITTSFFNMFNTDCDDCKNLWMKLSHSKNQCEKYCRCSILTPHSKHEYFISVLNKCIMKIIKLIKPFTFVEILTKTFHQILPTLSQRISWIWF